jgi:glycosyltransferase involved in cell wall biosynthesis
MALPFTEGGGFVVGTVGRLQPVKDQLTLIRAFARLLKQPGAPHAELRLVIVGDGPSRAQLEDAIRTAGLNGRVWLAGAREDVAELMQHFDLFVLSSLSEGISNTVLEAMASALPVVATRVGGNAELVIDGSTGALVPPGDEAALAAAIGTYCSQPSLAREHGAAGRRRIEEVFSVQSMVAAYDAVYDKLLPTRPIVDKRAEIGA